MIAAILNMAKSLFFGAVLFGPAAMQCSANPVLAFPGGGMQIYVPRETFGITSDGPLPVSTMVHPLPWSKMP